MSSPIVILASSRKLGGICLAGKQLVTRESRWVRPVSMLDTRSFNDNWLRRVAGTIPQVGMSVNIPLGRATPEDHQQENHSIASGAWRVTGNIAPAALNTLTDPEQPLWIDGSHSINGWNDRIPEYIALSQCRESLRFMKPTQLRFHLAHWSGKVFVRVSFDWAGEHYALSVTDIKAASRWLHKLSNGHNGLAEAYICISLGLPFNGHCYKLVAGVIEVDPEH